MPKAGTPITGPGGEIIDVPIDNPGDPYKEAPSVFITGNGFSANGIALLDTKGYVTEVRITDPGFGYKLNKPQDANKECIIDAFTMIRPGKGYTTAPDVYINGDKDIAEAIVENGQVISIRIKNREITFSSYPDVIILGGGGSPEAMAGEANDGTFEEAMDYFALYAAEDKKNYKKAQS